MTWNEVVARYWPRKFYDHDAEREQFLSSAKGFTPQPHVVDIANTFKMNELIPKVPQKEPFGRLERQASISQETPMSIFSSIISGLSKAENFLISMFTKGSTIAAMVAKLSPNVLAAILALFYDVMKTLLSAETAVKDATTGDIMGAITVSQTTWALLQQVKSDFIAGEKVIVSDIEQLGIAASTSAAGMVGSAATPEVKAA